MLMNKRIFILIIVLICVFATISFAQSEFISETISIKDGLSSNNSRDIVQDKYGYMWFSTTDGLNRYDGYEIRVFKNISGVLATFLMV